MNFCPKDLCEKLEKMGCRTSSGFFFILNLEEEDDKLVHEDFYEEYIGELQECMKCYVLEDFVANTEQARKNAQIVWPNDAKVICSHNEWAKENGLHQMGGDWHRRQYRHQMIDAEDPWEFLKETMRCG